MNYITNQSNHIIAADDDLLALLHLENIEELTKYVILGDIQFEILSDQNIHIITDAKSFSFKSHTSSLSSMIGFFNLVSLTSIGESSESILSDTQNITTADDPLFLKEETLSSLDNSIEADTIDELSISETKDFLTVDKKSTQDTSSIIIDVAPISKDIGISIQDYKLFLNDYIDTAISLEKDLRSTDSKKCSSAVTSLSQLSQILQLPLVNEVISKVTFQSSNKDAIIESFYTLLARLTIEEKPVQEASIQKVSVSDISIEKISVTKEPKPELEIKPKVIEESFGNINLEGITPIHFPFQLSEAAKDLSLPIELIKEFVHDFIQQGHIETDKMLLAYEKGDLKTIQNIGHMLKGASSNLRINALSNTLYEIQFCKDSNNLKGLIKQYWGQFLALEQYIDNLEK